ncbi:hypothetical protein GGI26_005049 [Coemansia sp. RSA 1358]|nr:hypothetical protein GGI26_005049 [Coemansia sp. RSA 1358]
MVVRGFGGWKATIPNPDATHGLGVWEIYRSHAETNLNGTKRTGDAMFIRWKSTLMSRIVHDFSYSFTIKKKAHLFKKRWLQVSNQWFQFDPGGEELLATAKLLAHFVPNKSSAYMNCEAGEKSLSHYFWDCKHIKRFWLLTA